MATRIKSSNVRSSGFFIAGGLQNLEYVLLENDELLITLQSIYRYLEIDADSALLAKDIIPAKLCVHYGQENANDFGIPATQVPAVCINIIELNAKSGSHKNEAINAMMLLTFLSSVAISNLVVQDNIKKQNTESLPLKVSWTN